MAERLLKLVLMAMGVASLTAVFPAAMPLRWMDAVHGWLGLGPMPRGPVVEYLARSLSALYAFHGGLLVLAATDIRRYGPIITYVGFALIAFAGGVTAIDLSAGLPLFWVAGEGGTTFVMGAIILACRRRLLRGEPGPAA
jgi:hypothetical protein